MCKPAWTWLSIAHGPHRVPWGTLKHPLFLQTLGVQLPLLDSPSTQPASPSLFLGFSCESDTSLCVSQIAWTAEDRCVSASSGSSVLMWDGEASKPNHCPPCLEEWILFTHQQLPWKVPLTQDVQILIPLSPYCGKGMMNFTSSL